MGKYSDKLMKGKVTSPSNEIIIVDEKYISKEPTIYTINVKEGSSNEFTILDSNQEVCYKCKSNSDNDTATICDSRDKPIITIKEGSTSTKIFFAEEKQEKQVLAKIHYKNSTKAIKHTIDYLNLATKKNEVLNFNCSSTYRASGVFYGREKEDAPMICRICKIQKKSAKEKDYQFKIEIAPSVDILIMIALTINITLGNNYDYSNTLILNTVVL